MTMTNAQAALIAAANSAVRGSAVPLEPVLKRAAAYLQWLDAQDAPEPPPKQEPETGFEQATRAITQCRAVSENHTRCLLAAGHKPPHRNSGEGVHWEDKHAVPLTHGGPVLRTPLVHFLTDPGARHALCGLHRGRTENGIARVTIRPREVTCPACKEELGL